MNEKAMIIKKCRDYIRSVGHTQHSFSKVYGIPYSDLHSFLEGSYNNDICKKILKISNLTFEEFLNSEFEFIDVWDYLDEIVWIQIIFPSIEEARDIAEFLVKDGLVTSAYLGKKESFTMKDGIFCHSEVTELIAVTKSSYYSEIEDFMKEKYSDSYYYHPIVVSDFNEKIE